MKVAFESSFTRDLREIRDQQLLGRVQRIIELVKDTQDAGSLKGMKKLQGYDNYYRIRVGDYRIGLEIIGDLAVFVRFLNRKDMYRYFP